jgi:hypothetical protein
MPGDTVRLKQMIADHGVTGVYLNSTGGNAMEGEAMAEIIHDLDTMTVVPNEGECNSICFLMFAAGANKYVGKGATIAVHSSGDKDHKENFVSGGITFTMARASRGRRGSVHLRERPAARRRTGAALAVPFLRFSSRANECTR